ncbi:MULTISPECIES: MarR family winged helix-turn-helix transcriptional regulator [Brevibacterium]|jgi:DNA-binding MarR family transcriptional regulator|uniref:MarR family winged helix-turn-helix transcriptional regulator n=1 Tax=Brevibacterium TaxID=1696 RepID=UPI001BA4A11C|nr:MarR family transcriptional regulator [Brevibacterium sp. W7.2]
MTSEESSDLQRGGPLSGSQLETWSALATVLEWLPPVLDAQLQENWGISHFEFGILFALSEADGHTLRMSALARFANSTLSRLSRAVARLEKRGLAIRNADPDDGRVTVARLTESGLDIVSDASPAHAELVRRLVFDALSDDQAMALRDASLRIADAIDAGAGWRPKQ